MGKKTNLSHWFSLLFRRITPKYFDIEIFQAMLNSLMDLSINTISKEVFVRYYFNLRHVFDFVTAIHAISVGIVHKNGIQSEIAFKCPEFEMLTMWERQSMIPCFVSIFSGMNEWMPFQWQFLTLSGQPSYHFIYILQLTRTHIRLYALRFYVKRQQHVVTSFVRFDGIVNDWYLFLGSVCLKRKGSNCQPDSKMKKKGGKNHQRLRTVYFAIITRLEKTKSSTWQCYCCSRWSK